VEKTSLVWKTRRDLPVQPPPNRIPKCPHEHHRVTPEQTKRPGGNLGGQAMTRAKISGISLGRGPIPSASHDTWSHRVEGIGRRLLTRKNRKNKKKDEPQNPEDSSTDGNPFKSDRSCTRSQRLSPAQSSGLWRRSRHVGKSRAHRERTGSSFEVRFHVKGRSYPCQVKR